MQTVYSWLANAVLFIHALVVFFNLAALPVIWIGGFRSWAFVRNVSFRISHLFLIGFIAAESALGMICPLTTWENSLRVKAGTGARYQGGYIEYWLHRVLFHDWDERIFSIAYGIFFGLVLATLFLIKPHRANRASKASAEITPASPE